MSITRSDLECMLFDEAAEPEALPLSLLEEITNGFSNEMEIGRGGFSVVYKGMLDNGAVVAVKKRLSTTYMYDKEFLAEVECLMKVKHKNIVRFLGYCADTHSNVDVYNGKLVMAHKQQRLLCFEYLPRGGLDNYITDSSGGLEWTKRYEIIKGICEGLNYLHQSSILHLDLKPANILLDEDMTPKINDFGLSRSFKVEQTLRVLATEVGGTIGYLAPEFTSREITRKFDLYSLGVIIIEILTGKRGYHAVENVLESWSNRLADTSERNRQWEQIRVCAEIGIECTDFNPARRPVSANHICDRLLETESAGGGDLLAIHPLALFFPLEPNKKVVTCPLRLTNDTDKHVAFRLMHKSGGSSSFLRLPLHGIVPPRSSYTVNVTTQEDNNELPRKSNMDDLILDSVTLLGDDDIDTLELSQPDNFFGDAKEAGNVVHEVTLKAFCTPRREMMRSKPHHIMSFDEEPTGSKPHHLRLQHLKKITDDFSDDRILGIGSFGVVYKGVLQSGKMAAVKKLLQATPSSQEQFENEVNLLMKLEHPNIVRLVGYCYETRHFPMHHKGETILASSAESLLCLEYMPNGSLDKYISDASSGFEWQTRRKIIEGISFGLQYLHEQSIIHLDLKPANILLDETLVPKIADFGLSRLYDQNQTISTAITGGTTPGYMPPEYLRGIVTPMSDIFSLGVIILEVITGHRNYPYDFGTPSKGFIKDELEKWRDVLMRKGKGSKYTRLETDCQQIKTCLEIGLACVNYEHTQRPRTKNIISLLQGLESTGWYIANEMPAEINITVMTEAIITVYPQELSFSFEPEEEEEELSSSLNLVNITGQHVAWMMGYYWQSSSNNWCGLEETKGILEPRTTYVLDVTSEQVVVHDTDRIHQLRSLVVSHYFDIDDISAEMFTRQALIHTVEVGVVLVPSSSEAQLQLSAEETSSQVILCTSGYPGPELRFPFEPNKSILCSLHLTNNTDEDVAFHLEEKFWCFFKKTLYGIVSPRSTHTLILVTEQRRHFPGEQILSSEDPEDDDDPELEDSSISDLILQSSLCDVLQDGSDVDHVESFQSQEECDIFFKAAKRYRRKVHKLKLKAVFEKMTSQSSPSPHGIQIISVQKTIGYPVFVEANPTEPWAVTIEDSHRTVHILNYDLQGLMTGSFTERFPVFAPTFIGRKKWLMISSDAGLVHVYSYEPTIVLIRDFRVGHSRVTSLAVHPSKPYVLSACGRTFQMDLWDWENDWKWELTFEPAHAAPVCQVVFNPKETNSFASASMDGTVKIWDLDSPNCKHTLSGHLGIVNRLDFFTSDDYKQYLISVSADKTAKIWDLQKMACIHTLDNFMSPLVCVLAHPSLPVLITGTKDGIVHVWSYTLHSSTTDFRLKRIFNIGSSGEVLSLACSMGTTRVVIGQPEAVSIMDLGDEETTSC